MKPMKWMISSAIFTLVVGGVFSAALAADGHGNSDQDAASRHEEALEAGHDGGHSVGVKQPTADKALTTPPGRVTLLGPKPFAKVGSSVTLSWNPVDGAEVYQIQIAKDPRYKWLVTNEQNLKAQSFEAQNLEKGQYFWRVAARKPGNDPSYTKGYFSSSSFEVR